MNTTRLITGITFFAIFAMAARVSVDTDTWWHLRTGAWIMEQRAIPQVDPFSYTRLGEEWRIPGWLVQVPMAWMYGVGGPGLLNLWVAGMVTLAFGFTWRAMEGGAFLKAFVSILAAVTAGVYWAARPYMMTFLLAAVFLWILEDWRRGKKNRLWVLPFLMLVWANSHGGFVVGVILFGVYAAGRLKVEGSRLKVHFADNANVSTFNVQRSTQSLILFGAALLIAAMLTPVGPRLLLYPFQTVRIEALQDFIQEWQSPNFHETQVQPFAWMIFLILGAVGVSKKGLLLEEFLLVAGFGYLGLAAGRNISLFALVGAVVLARHADGVLGGAAQALGVRWSPRVRVPRGLSILNGILLGIVALAAGVKAASIYPVSVNEVEFANFLPVEAVEFIRESQPEGRLFNSYNWGAYLLWALPEYPVFVDGRTDLYNDEVIGQWFQAARAEPGWEAVLEEWGVNLVLIEPGLPLARALEEADWEELYRDDVAVVYGR